MSDGLRCEIGIDLYSKGAIVLDTFSSKTFPLGHFMVMVIVHFHGLVAVK